MQRDGLDPDHAFVVLQRRPDQERVTRQTVAERLVGAPAFAD